MKKVMEEMRALRAEMFLEIRLWVFLSLTLTLYFAASLVLSNFYDSENENQMCKLSPAESRYWYRTHILLAAYGIITFTAFSLSVAGWLLKRADPAFSLMTLGLYALGAFGFWMCTIVERDTLNRLARALGLSDVET